MNIDLPKGFAGWAGFILASLAAAFVISTVAKRVPAVDQILRGA